MSNVPYLWFPAVTVISMLLDETTRLRPGSGPATPTMALLCDSGRELVTFPSGVARDEL